MFKLAKSKKSKSNVMFTSKKHSKSGIISTVLGIVSIIVLIILALYSGFHGGNSGMVIGGIGLAALIFSVAGFLIGIQSLNEDEVYYGFPVVGTSLNTILLIVYIIIYIMGVLL